MFQSMLIEVRLYATLRQYGPATGIGEPLRVEMAEGAIVVDLLHKLSLPRREVKTVFANNRHQDFAYRLHDGDRVAFFPPVGGG